MISNEIPLRFEDMADDEIQFSFHYMNDAAYRTWCKDFLDSVDLALRPIFGRFAEIMRLTERDSMFQRSVILYMIQKSDK